MSFSDHWHY